MPFTAVFTVLNGSDARGAHFPSETDPKLLCFIPLLHAGNTPSFTYSSAIVLRLLLSSHPGLLHKSCWFDGAAVGSVTVGIEPWTLIQMRPSVDRTPQQEECQSSML